MERMDENFINDLRNGEVITNDIYFNKTLLVKAGSIVNDALLKNLQNWGIKNLYISNYMSPLKRRTEAVKPLNKKEKIFYSKELFDIKSLFYESLQYVVSETRYGLILNNDAQISFLENLFISSLLDSRILTSLLELKKKDPYSYFHSFDVFLLGALLADWSDIEDIRTFAIGCLIHDIGKVKIDRSLLQKEATLSKTEFEEMQKHPLYGVEILAENGLPTSYIDFVKSHHERLDGSGYPEGLSGEAISKEVRLLAVVDTYSALTLQRPYREPFSSVKAIELLLSKKNKYDLNYVINLMELINIYPPDCIVRLSNGRRAKIKSVNENQPYFPILQELGTSKVYELPLNFSVTIIRYLEWNQISDKKLDKSINKKEMYWDSFLHQLLDGDEQEAIHYYGKLTEGMTENNAFIDIIVRLIKEVEAKRIEGQLSIGEEHDALLKIKDLITHNFK